MVVLLFISGLSWWRAEKRMMGKMLFCSPYGNHSLYFFANCNFIKDPV